MGTTWVRADRLRTCWVAPSIQYSQAPVCHVRSRRSRPVESPPAHNLKKIRCLIPLQLYLKNTADYLYKQQIILIPSYSLRRSAKVVVPVHLLAIGLCAVDLDVQESTTLNFSPSSQ